MAHWSIVVQCSSLINNPRMSRDIILSEITGSVIFTDFKSTDALTISMPGLAQISVLLMLESLGDVEHDWEEQRLMMKTSCRRPEEGPGGRIGTDIHMRKKGKEQG